MKNGLPSKASTVIIGAGIMGNSVAYWLSEMGRDDICLIDKGPLPDPGGSTGHASNFSFPISHTKEISQLTQRSREIYDEMDVFSWSGGIEVSRTPERDEELKRRYQLARAWGEPAELLSAEEVKEKVPYINEDVVTSGFYCPDAGTIDPLHAGQIMRDRAKENGTLTVSANTAVKDIHVENGEARAVETDKGTVSVENEIIIAAGVWSPKIAAMAGTRIPLTPLVHQLVSVGPIDRFEETEGEINFPVIRDMDARMYERQNGNDLEVGSYLHRPILWDAEDIFSNEEAPLSPTQPPLTDDAFEESMERSLEILPELLDDPDAGIRHAIDGLMHQTPDGAPLVGPMQDVEGLWAATALYIKDAAAAGEELAKWMTRDHCDIDIDATMNVNRFHEYGESKTFIKNRASEGYQKFYGIVHPNEQWQSSRPLRKSGFFNQQQDLEAEFYESAGWETPQWYESNEDLVTQYQDEISHLQRPNDWDSRWWSPIILAEHLHLRENVGMVDGSTFTVFDIIGDDALEHIQHVAVADADIEHGQSVYTPILDPEAGFRSDLTIARLDDDHFRVVTGGGVGGNDLAWFKRHKPTGLSSHIVNRSSELSMLGVWGPDAHRVIESVVDDDISDQQFGEARSITIGEVDVWALRISYVGEFGWELHVPMDRAARLWDIIYEAGQEYNIRPVGMGVYGTTGRMEKNYRLYGHELKQNYDPVEADITHHGVKNTDFIGKEAYRNIMGSEPVAKLCTLSVADHAPDGGQRRFMLGHEPVLDRDGNVLVDEKGRHSYVTSAGTGPSVGKHLLMAYLPQEYAEEGTQLQVEYFGQKYPVTVEVAGSEPLFDPDNERIIG
jgi:glycine cleavage system aminomethyltransferase T/glycine/D-amino acid oxidase-like deaminating enzyme